MNYNLFHVVRETAAEALAEYHAVADAVHHLGGALWTSLADGPGPSYVVIALPTGRTLDALEGLEPVLTMGKAAFELIDPDFFPLESDEEQTDDEQSALPR